MSLTTEIFKKDQRRRGENKMQLNFFTQKPIINLSLYLAEVKSTDVDKFCADVKGRYGEMTAELTAVNPDDDFWKQENNLIIADLCGLPEWEIIFSSDSVKLSSDSAKVYSTAISVYRSCLHREWNACLYDSNAKAVAVDFDDSFACMVSHLFNQHDRSDKVYHLYLLKESNSYKVVSRYGRRDKSLKTAQKSYESLEGAEKEWQGIYASKLRKGYEIGKPIMQVSLGLGVWG